MSQKGKKNAAGAEHPAVARALLAEQTAAFIKHGGEIEKVPTGQSGQQNMSYFGRSRKK